MFVDAVGSQTHIVGDELLVTDPTRVKKALKEGACDALLMKVNLIGSISEAIEAATMSQAAFTYDRSEVKLRLINASSDVEYSAYQGELRLRL